MSSFSNYNLSELQKQKLEDYKKQGIKKPVIDHIAAKWSERNSLLSNSGYIPPIRGIEQNES